MISMPVLCIAIVTDALRSRQERRSGGRCVIAGCWTGQARYPYAWKGPQRRHLGLLRELPPQCVSIRCLFYNSLVWTVVMDVFVMHFVFENLMVFWLHLDQVSLLFMNFSNDSRNVTRNVLCNIQTFNIMRLEFSKVMRPLIIALSNPSIDSCEDFANFYDLLTPFTPSLRQYDRPMLQCEHHRKTSTRRYSSQLAVYIMHRCQYYDCVTQTGDRWWGLWTSELLRVYQNSYSICNIHRHNTSDTRKHVSLNTVDVPYLWLGMWLFQHAIFAA